jgi:hypothetical protein
MRTGTSALVLLSSIALSACGGGGGGGGGGVAGTVTFVHTADASNVFGNFTVLDHPRLNGEPGAIPLVTHAFDAGGSPPTPHPHHIAVGYNVESGRWLVLNADGDDMEADRSFHVCVPAEGPEAFVVVASAANVTFADYVVQLHVGHPAVAGDPSLRVLVTQAVLPGGSAVYNDRAIGVWYDGTGWTALNEDRSAVPLGAAFHVYVAPASETFVHTAGLVKGDTTWIEDPRLDGDPFAMPIVTQSLAPNGVYNTSPVSVVYDHEFGRWGVVNSGAPTLPSDVSFVVRVP